jgi:hemin uptake protein HemP
MRCVELLVDISHETGILAGIVVETLYQHQRQSEMGSHAIDHSNLQPASHAVVSLRSADPPRMLRSDDLFNGKRLVLIEHAGQQYRLLITRNDRLILQK